MVYVTASRNFLLFIFEAIAEISSSKNKKVFHLSLKKSEDHAEQQMWKEKKRQMWNPRT